MLWNRITCGNISSHSEDNRFAASMILSSQISINEIDLPPYSTVLLRFDNVRISNGINLYSSLIYVDMHFIASSQVHSCIACFICPYVQYNYVRQIIGSSIS